MKQGILILGHGSKRPEANEVFTKIVEMIKGKVRGGERVACAFLQFAQPDIPTAVASLYEAGIREVLVMPLFLYPGNHIVEDIPALLQEEEEKYPGLCFTMTTYLGADERIADIAIDRIYNSTAV